MEPMAKPAAMDSSDFEIIDGPDDSPDIHPPHQPSKSEANSPNTRMGTIYVEAQVKPAYTGSLAELTAKLEDVFRSKRIHAVEVDHEMIGDNLYAECLFPDCVRSLKAVDIVDTDDDHSFVLVEGHTVNINAYVLRDGKDAEIEGALSLCGDPILLPCAGFDNAWERLIFDEQIKKNLIVFMTNLLRFSWKPGHRSLSTVNRLVLLSGPPGTGASPQIRILTRANLMKGKRRYTILLQLNAATLLSQYFGQSAVKIHSIFEALAAQSEETASTLTILLIDEIESLAASRETANAKNEVHDAVRATNALLTGFDMVKNNANVLIICTSNMSDSLDAAFIDRCGRHIKVPQPTLAARYEILRHSINGLVEREIIKTPMAPLPTFRHAEYRVSTDAETAGWALRCLADKLKDGGPNGQVVSGRWLSQLAEIALANELGPNALCTVDDAVKLMSRYIDVTCGHQRSKRSWSQGAVATEDDNPVKKAKLQPKGVSPYLEENLKCCASEMERTIDQWIAIFREEGLNKRFKPSEEEMETIADKVFDRWGGCPCDEDTACYCSEIVDNRLRDYIEHGTPMYRRGSH
ncbi:hypothetical protein V501_04047 [Pseudogymnoascus sp. VKM F-4519 (FW-2642)]|nr:hypothetical protein V501_04047 [Pseudogymnoascus sp. VKM F-4519 (FW-2642)]